MRGAIESDARDFSPEAVELLRKAAADLRFLLARGYGKKASLKLVGDRFELVARQRHLLYRAISAPEAASLRLAKRLDFPRLSGLVVGVDGYNVLITVEAALAGAPIIDSDDGFLRDIVGAFSSFRKSEYTEKSLELVFTALKAAGPAAAHFYFDIAMSRSGLLAQRVNDMLAGAGLQGSAQTAHAPDREIRLSESVAATGDSALLDRVNQAFDLPREVCRRCIPNAWIIKLCA